jgi:uncharacterized membrane-anchored protein YjiN (DUF445 family)
MRRFATALLGLMAGLFALSVHFDGAQPLWLWPWLRAFTEAAMVGGLADWFAVTALFRHPMGLPIPHTAIIPANKNRIADSMAQFLRYNFLTPQVVARRMRAMNIAGALGGFLNNPNQATREPSRQNTKSRANIARFASDLLHSSAGEQIGAMAKSQIHGQLDKLDLAPLLGQLLDNSIENRRHLPLLESLLRWTGLILEENEDLIRNMIHDRANSIMRWTGLDERLANGILDGLYRLLAECIVDPNHPLRAKLEDGLHSLAHDLQHSPDMAAKIARMKAEILANPAMAAWLDTLWDRFRASVLRKSTEVSQENAAISEKLGESFTQLGQSLQSDAALQITVNRFARRVLVGVASRYGGAIVTLVSETVKRWDAQTVTDRIEGAVGRDLQFIRINGTLVGGLVGLLIHAYLVSI